MVVTSWLSVGCHLVISGDQVESRTWWLAGGSTESPDECACAVMGVTHQSSLSPLLFPLFTLFFFIALDSPILCLFDWDSSFLQSLDSFHHFAKFFGAHLFRSTAVHQLWSHSLPRVS